MLLPAVLFRMPKCFVFKALRAIWDTRADAKVHLDIGWDGILWYGGAGDIEQWVKEFYEGIVDTNSGMTEERVLQIEQIMMFNEPTCNDAFSGYDMIFDKFELAVGSLWAQAETILGAWGWKRAVWHIRNQMRYTIAHCDNGLVVAARDEHGNPTWKFNTEMMRTSPERIAKHLNWLGDHNNSPFSWNVYRDPLAGRPKSELFDAQRTLQTATLQFFAACENAFLDGKVQPRAYDGQPRTLIPPFSGGGLEMYPALSFGETGRYGGKEYQMRYSLGAWAAIQGPANRDAFSVGLTEKEKKTHDAVLKTMKEDHSTREACKRRNLPTNWQQQPTGVRCVTLFQTNNEPGKPDRSVLINPHSSNGAIKPWAGGVESWIRGHRGGCGQDFPHGNTSMSDNGNPPAASATIAQENEHARKFLAAPTQPPGNKEVTV
ncbi:unnamed protein product [Amoebophrya sp. A25]|nr:unnamed protein product [Amoebophrya sp. A25]|eukprot:GSA25T00023992001.1